jgi:hypothetical protein
MLEVWYLLRSWNCVLSSEIVPYLPPFSHVAFFSVLLHRDIAKHTYDHLYLKYSYKYDLRSLGYRRYLREMNMSAKQENSPGEDPKGEPQSTISSR